MDKQELIQKLQDIEWEDFEVKEARHEVPKNSWETVSAFANTAGGWLIFGVKKSGKNFEVVGVEHPDKVEHDFLTVLQGEKFNKKIQAAAKKYDIGGKAILGFYIPSTEAKSKPVYFNSHKNTFIRTGSGDQRATQEEIDALYRNSSFNKKDEELTPFSVKDLDQETIKRYRSYLENVDPEHRYNQLPTEEFLEKLHVLINGKVTIGGLFVFGDEDTIGRIISDFRIDYLEIMGTSYEDAPSKYHCRLSEEKNLFSFYFSIFERLKKKIEVPFKQKGKWLLGDEDQPQVKAITDYFSSAKPRIRVFLNRIEFFNPGSLPKDIKYILKEDFSMPRNPTIARIFRHVRLSENIGSGFDKMIKGWVSHYRIKPEISGDFDYYKIVFNFDGAKGHGKGSGLEKVREKVREKTREKILRFIKEAPEITTFDLALKSDVTPKAIARN